MDAVHICFVLRLACCPFWEVVTIVASSVAVTVQCVSCLILVNDHVMANASDGHKCLICMIPLNNVAFTSQKHLR